MQLGGGREKAQDAEENEEAVRDGPSDSSSSEGGETKEWNKGEGKKFPMQKRVLTMHWMMRSNTV